MSTVLDEKDPDQDRAYAIDARWLAYHELKRDWPYAVGQIVKSPRHTGFYYECSIAGETRRHWPELPRAEGLTFSDGSVTWLARHPDDATLPTISTVTWDVSPSGLSVAAETITGGVVEPVLAGGADGEDYELTAHVTWSTGQADDITVTIPVRQQ